MPSRDAQSEWDDNKAFSLPPCRVSRRFIFWRPDIGPLDMPSSVPDVDNNVIALENVLQTADSV